MKTKLAVLLTISGCVFGYFVLTALADDRELDELRERAAALNREFEEHMRNGNATEARGAKLRAIVAEKQADQLAERLRAREHEERERHERELQEERERDAGGLEQIEHIRTAADHLHAAGMHELADDLLRQAEQRQRDLERRHEGHRDEGLQRHIEELTHRVEQLTHHLESVTKHVEEQDQRLERMGRAILELSDRREE